MRAILLAAALLATPAFAETFTVAYGDIPEWKPVYGRVEARETVPARARIGGTVVALSVSEGDLVQAGQEIARIHDDKLSFQIAALDAQISAFEAQLATAETELKRGEALVERGVATVQRLDQLRTSADVLRGQIAATEAQRALVEQQAAEGQVLAPADGRVLTVPVTPGAVILPGEPIATVGGGGFFLRLAIPERHAGTLEEGASLLITGPEGETRGRVAKLYPQIEDGRIIADVEVAGLQTAYVGLRLLVSLPVGHRQALLVPEAAVTTRGGIDFVMIEGGAERAVVPGNTIDTEAGPQTEILTGLEPGDIVVTP